MKSHTTVLSQVAHNATLPLVLVLLLPPAGVASTFSRDSAPHAPSPPLWSGRVFTVNTTDNRSNANPAGGCDTDLQRPREQCSLRAAIQAANFVPGQDTISFDIPVSNPNCDSATGRCTIDLNANALPIITDSVGIIGPGAGRLSIRRGNPALRIDNAIAVTLSGITIIESGNIDSGGALLNQWMATVSIINCVLSDNVAGLRGGAIHNTGGGTVNVIDTTLRSNRSVQGGGITNFVGRVNIIRSTLTKNKATGEDRPVLGITEGLGGGIYNQGGVVTIVNSTVTDNAAQNGGGIYNEGTLNVSNCTIARNLALGLFGTGNGGGIFNDSSATANVKSSIIAANDERSDVSGTFQSQGFNLIGIASSSAGFSQLTDRRGTGTAPLDPGIDPCGLRDNGGPTQTIALRAGSPAIDKGTSNGLTGRLLTDQRGEGFPRVIAKPGVPNAFGGDGADIGAFESGST